MRVEAEFGGAVQADAFRGEQGVQARRQRAVANAAAADVDVSDVGRGGDDCVEYRLRGVFQQRLQYVFWPLAAFQTALKPVERKQFAPRAFGVGQGEIGVVEQGGEQFGQHLPLCRFFAVLVVGKLPDMPHPCVHQHIARAGVETGGGRVRRQDADVGDAADVEDDAGFGGMAE